jgi:peptide/nickel transport system substrate-binding protein
VAFARPETQPSHTFRYRYRRASLRKPLVLMAAAGTVLVSACGDNGTTSPQAAGTPKDGGTMTFLLQSEARGLDPFTAAYNNVVDGNRMAAIYDELVWADPNTGTVQPQLAESLLPKEPTAKVWMLTLRSDVKFTDGTPLDANAVKVNWDRHADPKVQSQQNAAAAGLQTEVIDDTHLQITLPERNANFDRMVATQLTYIASPKCIASQKCAENPVGAGPFMLNPGNWHKGQSLTLDRNPTYFKKGAPYLDHVVFKVDPDPGHAVGELESGRADATSTIDPVVVAQARDNGLGTVAVILSGGQMISFNTASGPFADPDARRAVANALSADAINQQIFEGTGAVAHGIFSASSPIANNQLDQPDNNPDEAARLFAKVTANGSKPLNATMIIPNAPNTVKVAQYIQQTLAKYPGVKLNVETLDVPTFITRSNIERRFEIKIDQTWLPDPEPILVGFLRSDSFSNCCFYKNPAVDQALITARTTTDNTVRRDAYTQVQIALNRDVPFWVYQEAIGTAVFAPRITGVSLHSDGVALFDRIGLRR